MEKTDNFKVALTKRLCPVCLHEMDGEIVMNTELTEKAAKEVENLHNKIVGYSDHMCKDCEDKIKEGVYLIGIDPAKSDKSKNGLYRSGRYIGIKMDAFKTIADGVDKAGMDFAEKKHFIFVEDVVIENITKAFDLFKKVEDGTKQ